MAEQVAPGLAAIPVGRARRRTLAIETRRVGRSRLLRISWQSLSPPDPEGFTIYKGEKNFATGGIESLGTERAVSQIRQRDRIGRTIPAHREDMWTGHL